MKNNPLKEFLRGILSSGVGKREKYSIGRPHENIELKNVSPSKRRAIFYAQNIRSTTPSRFRHPLANFHNALKFTTFAATSEMLWEAIADTTYRQYFGFISLYLLIPIYITFFFCISSAAIEIEIREEELLRQLLTFPVLFFPFFFFAASMCEGGHSKRHCTGQIPTHLGHVRTSLPGSSRPSYLWTIFSWMTRA